MQGFRVRRLGVQASYGQFSKTGTLLGSFFVYKGAVLYWGP